VALIESAFGITPSAIPNQIFQVCLSFTLLIICGFPPHGLFLLTQIPDGWASGEVPTGLGGKGPLTTFYWEKGAGKKPGECIYEPPKGSKVLTHQGGGVFA